ncbi:cellulose biosynthesis cyclic di-GMP-binding regulatory protein BcsB [Leptothermofonsia sp. ETS-13]|uniref:cellulose biosynthesis cyclic di-GMP-binding regulatory protein BcsB n=1 Tax=Leptothermofonsia sp. ETS-13 TaxID=3035696 RepID=UPI003BA3551D
MKPNSRPKVIHPAGSRRRSHPLRLSSGAIAWLLLSTQVGVILSSLVPLAQAQSNLQKQEDQLIRQFAPPPAPLPAPVYQPAPAPPPAADYTAPAPAPAQPSQPASDPAERTASKPGATADRLPLSQYVYEFNRDPRVGNSLQLRGTYSEARLKFTRPRNWDLKSVKALIRFQHSPALLANRSNLTVRVNGTSVGSVPLNRKQSQTGQILVNIPPNLIQNYNELTLVAQQNNSPTCSDPADQTLWTEILPNSRLLFDFYPKAIALDFSHYPYPLFDDLSLDANQVAYLQPNQINESWLTSIARFQAGMGRLADFRPLESQLVKKLDEVPANHRLVIIGTPQEQPTLKSLKLPYRMADNQFIDGSKVALPEDVGLLMLTTSRNSNVPVLVVTGNGPEGVAKALQFLLQPQQRKLATGAAVLVDQLSEAPTPPPRQWARYLPEENSFQLSDLKDLNDQPIQDVTVRGAYAPPVEFNFRALPDDRFKRGNTMTLVYSHSPQVNPRLSTVEVRIDGIPIGGKRLTSENGANRESVNLNLPEDLIQPTSKMQVAFNLVPKEPGECGRVVDQQLWGTVHGDTRFNLQRDQSVKLPDLKLLQTGYPFTAPQDLSTTAIALPDNPSSSELETLLEFSERLGRLSQSDGIQLQVYTVGTLPEPVRQRANLVGIGKREHFPFPEVFQSRGFQIGDLFGRRSDQSQVQTLPDTGGVVKQILSPWNGDRVLLALTAQTDAGLDRLKELLAYDSLFFRLKDDTVVINTSEKNPSQYKPDAWAMQFFQEADKTQRIDNSTPLTKASRFLQDHWYFLPTGIVTASLVLYGVVQLYLKRVAVGDKR